MDVVHPLEAKRGCEALQRALKMVEDNIKGMFSDVQGLQQGNYHQADQMHKRSVPTGRGLHALFLEASIQPGKHGN